MWVRGSSWAENATGCSSISLGLKDRHPPKKTDLTMSWDGRGLTSSYLSLSTHKGTKHLPINHQKCHTGTVSELYLKSNKMIFNTPQKDNSLHSSLIVPCLSEMPPDPAVSQELQQRQFQGNLSPALVLAHSTTRQTPLHLDYPPRPLCWVQSSAWPELSSPWGDHINVSSI